MVGDCSYYFAQTQGATYTFSNTRGHLHFLRASVFKELLELLCKIYQLLINFPYAQQQLLINFFAVNYSLAIYIYILLLDTEKYHESITMY